MEYFHHTATIVHTHRSHILNNVLPVVQTPYGVVGTCKLKTCFFIFAFS